MTALSSWYNAVSTWQHSRCQTPKLGLRLANDCNSIKESSCKEACRSKDAYEKSSLSSSSTSTSTKWCRHFYKRINVSPYQRTIEDGIPRLPRSWCWQQINLLIIGTWPFYEKCKGKRSSLLICFLGQGMTVSRLYTIVATYALANSNKPFRCNILPAYCCVGLATLPLTFSLFLSIRWLVQTLSTFILRSTKEITALQLVNTDLHLHVPNSLSPVHLWYSLSSVLIASVTVYY